MRGLWTMGMAAMLAANGSALDLRAALAANDVVWTTPSENSAGSMPIGNGEVVLNVWVEKGTGDIVFLIGRTDSLSEISRLLKVGRVRVKIQPSPFLGNDFRQRLNLRDGVIEVSGSGEKVRLFVDSDQHVVHVAGTFKNERRVSAAFERWRDAERLLPDADKRSAWTAQNAPFPLVESADELIDAKTSNRVGWRHVNRSSIVPKIWEEQSLTGLTGTFDPLFGRVFGGLVEGKGLSWASPFELRSSKPINDLAVAVAALTIAPVPRSQGRPQRSLELEAAGALAASPVAKAEARTRRWWNAYWSRSYVFVKEPPTGFGIPDNAFPVRKGADSSGGNRFVGEIEGWVYWDRILSASELGVNPQQPGSMPEGKPFHPTEGFTLNATITPKQAAPGRIFDKLTAGTSDGFLFDTHPGRSLRLIVGSMELSAPNCLRIGERQMVAATYDATTGEAKLYLEGKVVAHRLPEKGSPITRGYVLQRYVQACQGRGALPIKFNGGTYTVEPTPMGIKSNPDYRSWGDAFWFQNTRHMYHPMLASGDFGMMEPFFRLYEATRPLAESRSATYHGVKGSYIPETMTAFGTYAGGDYGWDRTGLQPKDVQCPWWDDAWNQTPELLALMLDRWDYTRDKAFLTTHVLPMAESALLYFDTRFAKDANGRIVLDPTQVVETYWEGVVNDMPAVAGLIEVTERLCALPRGLVPAKERAFFERMRKACPELPLETRDGKRQLAPAQKYAPKISNVENGELYGVWPFRLVGLGRPKLLAEAKSAYANRKNRLDNGWGYDGNVAALLGMQDEAARILAGKVRNSHPAYRWPATWGPNFDWLPDQNHGGNLLNQTHLMLLQCDSLEAGGAIRLLPAWPKTWDVSFRLFAPGNTTVECEFSGGKVRRLKVTPASRRKDVVGI